MSMVRAMAMTMITWSMEQFDPKAVESFIMAGEGTKCCKKQVKTNQRKKVEQ